jgi:hypothetical protein
VLARQLLAVAHGLPIEDVPPAPKRSEARPARRPARVAPARSGRREQK